MVMLDHFPSQILTEMNEKRKLHLCENPDEGYVILEETFQD